MMRQLLEEDKYSVNGSVVDTDSSDDEGNGGDGDNLIYAISGSGSKEATLIALNRGVVARAARKRLRMEGRRVVMDTTGSRKRANSIVIVEEKDGVGVGLGLGLGLGLSGTRAGMGSMNGNVMHSSPMGLGDNLSGDDSTVGRGGRKKKRKKVKRGAREEQRRDDALHSHVESSIHSGGISHSPELQAQAQKQAMDLSPELDMNMGGGNTIGDSLQGAAADESSIFGQTTGSSNATWVECDKCKKVRCIQTIICVLYVYEIYCFTGRN